MPAIVLDLQAAATDHQEPVSGLLRKALVVSEKLGFSDMAEQCKVELNGYLDKDPPAFRRVHMGVYVRLSAGSWFPLQFHDPRVEERCSTQHVCMGVTELEHLLAATTEGLNLFTMLPEDAALLQRGMPNRAPMRMQTTAAAIAGILDHIRNAILIWALDLEKRGILGEGMTFTAQERSRVVHAPASVTNIFHGTVTQPQITTGSYASPIQNNVYQPCDTAGLLDLLRRLERSLAPLESDEQRLIEANIATVREQLEAPKPKGHLVKTALTSMATIMEGATGGALGTFIVELGKYIG